jgi:hypothetical protein
MHYIVKNINSLGGGKVYGLLCEPRNELQIYAAIKFLLSYIRLIVRRI